MSRSLIRLSLFLATFACLVSFYTSTARAGYIEEKDGKTIIHVKVFRLPDPTQTDTASRANAAGVKLFKKRFPEIFREKYRDIYKANPKKYGHYNWDHVEIELEPFSGIVVEGVENDLLAIAGNMSADILYINFRKSDNYIRNGFLYPLDEWMDKLPQKDKDRRIHPKIWPVIKRKGPGGVERTWSLPYGGALGRVLLFRKDLFDEYKIPYPDIHWTWEQMLDACKIITRPELDRYGLRLGRGRHESWYWCTFLWSAGGEVMTYNKETDEWRCVFDTLEAAKALDFYTRLSAEKWIDSAGKVRRGYSSKDASDSHRKWAEGKIGMKVDYIDEKLFANINPDITGMVPVPLGPPNAQGVRIRGGELNSRMMGIFGGVKDAAVRDAAFEYMWFYDSDEALRAKTKIMVEGGLGRFLNPDDLDRYGYPEIKRLSPKGWSDIFKIAVETGRPEPYGKNSNFAYQMMTIPMQQAEQLMLREELPTDDAERLKVMHQLLIEATKKANEVMIGILTPQQRKWRKITAALALMAIGIAFTLVFRNIFKIFTPPATATGKKGGGWEWRKYWSAYLLLIPAALTILLWHYAPLVRGSFMAFMDYNVMGNSKWTGLENFGNVLWDASWWQALWNSMRYSTLVISLTFLPPIILAILLQEVPRGKLLFRTLFYLPAVITGLVTLLLWKMFYTPTEFGSLNRVLMNIPAVAYVVMGLVMLYLFLTFAKRLLFHEAKLPAIGFVVGGLVIFYACISLASPILFPGKEAFGTTAAQFIPRLFTCLSEPYKWLSDTRTAMIACVIPMVWAGMGPGCLIYLAALKGIADDFYEAADIDGANFIDKILFVVFPILKPLILINFVGVFIATWMASANILAMTGGGANTEVAGLKIFYEAFTYLRMGPATAMAWLLGFLMIGFTVHQLRILSRLEFKTTGDK